MMIVSVATYDDGSLQESKRICSCPDHYHVVFLIGLLLPLLPITSMAWLFYYFSLKCICQMDGLGKIPSCSCLTNSICQMASLLHFCLIAHVIVLFTMQIDSLARCTTDRLDLLFNFYFLFLNGYLQLCLTFLYSCTQPCRNMKL